MAVERASAGGKQKREKHGEKEQDRRVREGGVGVENDK